MTAFNMARVFIIHPSSSAGGTDVTPNAVNWADVVYDFGLGTCGVESKQITGISSSISIEIQPGTGTEPVLYYQITSSQVTGTTTGTPSSPWVAVTSNTTVSINNNQWLSFVCNNTGDTRTATIINTSDGNATLDTFNYKYQTIIE